MEQYNTDDIIFALATPWARSALAIIRTSGDGCVELLSSSFSSGRRLREAKNATLIHGYILDGEGAQIDEVVLAVNRNRHGYTKEESVEITCHGSLSVIRAILARLQEIGMRQALGGEFTLRAFLHGAMDLTQAEAVMELVDAQSDKGRAMALSRLGGSLRIAIDQIKSDVLQILSQVEVQLDYAEDEVDDFVFPVEELASAVGRIQSLEESYCAGTLYSQGVRVVLAGETNAGKSSLFNMLLKEQRAIVSDVHGTTRDYIEASCQIRGIPVRLYDTAGLRESDDVIESEGIRRTRELMDNADIILYLADSTREVPEADDRTIIVRTKKDIDRDLEGLAVSTVTGEGIKELLDAIVAKVTSGVDMTSTEHVAIESERQKKSLGEAREALSRALTLVLDSVPLDIVAVELKDALDSLGELTGEVRSDDILDKIFSGFCVGK